MALRSVEQLRVQLTDPSSVREDPFSFVQALCALASDEQTSETELQELVLRTLEHRDVLSDSRQILDALVREVGLFPYLEDPDELSLADRIAYEFHKPANMDDRGIVFHRPQAYVYRELMAGKSVVLSAPTSFGKSLVIDAVIASGKFNTILVIVPSIALIDETRRRLSAYSQSYKVITHPFQQLAQRNILVFTQERVLEFANLDRIDFFVVDEFYKLAPTSKSDYRSALLNQAFYQLARRGKQFYMLGPSVTGVSPDLRRKLEFTWISDPYQTVVSELHQVEVGDDEMEALERLCRSLAGPTIIFCKSPTRAAEVARELVRRRIGSDISEDSPARREAAEWIARNYHPDWHVVQALRSGIGVHHGRIPRALAQFIVRAFDEGWIKFLICTSTLIEGVNTKAENIVILDDKIDRRRYDFFTFNNIRGRSGRMFRHFVGHVYLFHAAPKEDLPLIDIPAFTQSGAAADSLLLQLDESDLQDRSRDRLKTFREQQVLSYSVLKENIGIDPEAQIAVARDITANLSEAHRALSWSQFPQYAQLVYVCKLIFRHFGGSRLGAGSARSPEQLAVRLRNLGDTPQPHELIRAQMPYSASADDAVQNVLDFLRLWANFNFPRLLRALDRIQRDVFTRHRLGAGNYEVYAARVESYFLDPALVALDEYGVPLQLARRLGTVLGAHGDLDQVLSALRNLRVEQLRGISNFERDLLIEAQRYLR